MELKSLHDIGIGLAGAEKYALMPQRDATPIGILYCPTRRLPLAYPTTSWSAQIGGYYVDKLVAKSDYAACMGDGSQVEAASLPGTLAEGDSLTTTNRWDVTELGDPNANAGGTPGGFNGINFLRGRIQVKDIPDGTSHTYMIGEKVP